MEENESIIYPTRSPESFALAYQAEKEQRENGQVSVICPKCGQHPVVRITSERLYVRCSCGYVANGEIYF